MDLASLDVARMYDTTSLWILSHALQFLSAIVVLVLGWFLSGFLSRQAAALLPRTQRFDTTISPLVSQLVRYAVLIITFVIVLSQFGVQTASILAVLGAAGLAIALALQGTLTNIASGVMLIWLRPFNVGEYIDAEGTTGTVVEIGLFATQLRNIDGIFVFVPNSRLWNARIVNYSRERTRRIELKMSIPYDADIGKAREILLDLARDDRVLETPAAPAVKVSQVSGAATELTLMLWTATIDNADFTFDLKERIKTRFTEAEIKIV